QGGGEVPAGQPAGGPAAVGEGAVITAGVARGQGAQGAEQVGDGAAAHGEEGGQGQQDEAVIGGARQGRGQRLEDGVDGRGESVMVAVDLAAGGAGLLGESAAVGPAPLLGAAPLGLAG